MYENDVYTEDWIVAVIHRRPQTSWNYDYHDLMK